MQSPIIVKLGGSILTEKSSNEPVLRTVTVKRLAREVAQNLRAPLILLHGAGSFGHPLAHKYKLSGRALSYEALVGAGRTAASVRALNGVLIEALIAAGVPVVPLQASAMFEERKGVLVCKNPGIVRDILAQGGVPVLGGDIVIADRKHIEIASADRLAVYFAKHFRSKRILFATDVDGVYANYPPKKGEHPLKIIRRVDIERITKKMLVESFTDVTGAMGGKLRALLPLRKVSVTVFNGLTRGYLEKVLRGVTLGTSITL